MYTLIKKFIEFFRIKQTISIRSYKKIFQPDPIEYAKFLKQRNYFYSIGDDVAINTDLNATDPAYVRIGNNSTLSSCTLLGHDGVVRILNTAYGKKLDSVGKIDIKDNCFIGHGAIVLPNVTIGPNSIVAAGSLVTKDVPPGVIVGGVPAKVIGKTEDLVARLEARTATYPWRQLIEDRFNAFDPAIEPELVRRRVEYFYGKKP